MKKPRKRAPQPSRNSATGSPVIGQLTLGNLEQLARIRVVHFRTRRESPDVDEEFGIVRAVNKTGFVGDRACVRRG
jgi:hypothetical protein